jgi:small subunit ribosomal protein S21
LNFNKNTNFGNQKGLSVEVRNDNFNDAMRKFKRKIQDDGRLQEVKQRQEYIKPSERRAREKAAARARWLKKLKNETQLKNTRN